jgi:hypothetical protein
MRYGLPRGNPAASQLDLTSLALSALYTVAPEDLTAKGL